MSHIHNEVKYLTMREFAEKHGIPYMTIKTRIRVGRLPFVVFGGKKMIREDEVFIDKRFGGGGHKDRTGQRFGKLVAVSFSEMRNKNAHWLCKCDCGNTCIVSAVNLLQGKTKSCGCLMGSIENSQKIKKSLEKYAIEKTRVCFLSNKNTASNTSGRRGVTYRKDRGTWIAILGLNGRKIYLGSFHNFDDAVRAREEAEEKYYKKIIEKWKKSQEQ